MEALLKEYLPILVFLGHRRRHVLRHGGRLLPGRPPEAEPGEAVAL